MISHTPVIYLTVLRVISFKIETGNTVIRFGLALETSPEMWLRLQSRYKLEKAQDETDLDLPDKIKPVMA